MADWFSAAEVVDRDLDSVDLRLSRALSWRWALKVSALVAVGVALAGAALVVGTDALEPQSERSRIEADLDRMEAEYLADPSRFAALEEAELDALVALSKTPRDPMPMTYPLVLLAVASAFSLSFALLAPLAWWWQAPVWLRIARHWVELDGVRVELAELTDLAIVDGRVQLSRREGPPLLSGDLLKPTECGYFLEAADEILQLGTIAEEQVAAQRTRAALEPLRSLV